jgi:hypothetical protein
MGISGEEGRWSVAEAALLPRGASGGWSAAFSTALLETVGVGVHLQDVNVVGDAIE